MHLTQSAGTKSTILLFLFLATGGVLSAEYGDSAYFTYQIGGPVPPPEYYSITSQTPGRQATGLTVRTSGQYWLQASLSSTVTPSTLTVSVNPVNMTAGSYYGTVEVVNPSSTLTFDVNLIVTAPLRLTASPSSLSFSAVQGGSAPPVQTLVIGASVASTPIYKSPSYPTPSWLSAPGWFGFGISPASMQVSVNPNGLAPGTYTATLGFHTVADDATVTVPVTFVVTAPPPVLRTSTNQLQFQHMVGTATPAPQTVAITSSGTPLTTSISLSAPWLTASTLSGVTPFNVNIGLNPSGLAVGTYRGQAIVTTTGFTNPSTQTIDVRWSPELRQAVKTLLAGR